MYDNQNFYSHTSYEVRLEKQDVHLAGNQDFYSHTSYEVRPILLEAVNSAIQFLLTHLIRGATNDGIGLVSIIGFLLTHLIRGATILAISRKKR